MFDCDVILIVIFLIFFFQCFDLNEEMLESREVVNIDIAYDDLPEKHYVPEEVRNEP